MRDPRGVVCHWKGGRVRIYTRTSRNAWRGLYFYWLPAGHLNGREDAPKRHWNGRLLGRVVLSPPYEQNGPRLNIAVPLGWYVACSGQYHPRVRGVRIPLPWVRWKYPAGRVRVFLHRQSGRFWHNVNGIHGWGSTIRAERIEWERARGAR